MLLVIFSAKHSDKKPTTPATNKDEFSKLKKLQRDDINLDGIPYFSDMWPSKTLGGRTLKPYISLPEAGVLDNWTVEIWFSYLREKILKQLVLSSLMQCVLLKHTLPTLRGYD